jgi:hypothetical protein
MIESLRRRAQRRDDRSGSLPTLGLGLVYKAIALYLEHEEELRRLLGENARRMEQLMAAPAATATLAQLRERMANLPRAQREVALLDRTGIM